MLSNNINNKIYSCPIINTPAFKGNAGVNNDDSFFESLTRSYVSTGFLQGYNEIKGKAGNSELYLKETEPTEGAGKIKKYTGKIGDIDCEFEIKDNKEVSGTFDDKKINFKFEKNNYNEFFVRGCIDDDILCFTNGSETNEIKDEKDIIITVLSIMGYKLSVKEGLFLPVGLSKQAREDMSSQNFTDWQIAQQNQMMAQSFAVRNQILEKAELFSEPENLDSKPSNETVDETSDKKETDNADESDDETIVDISGEKFLYGNFYI